MPNYEWILIREFPLDKDLLPLLKHLTVQGIACHVSEAHNQQQLFIREAEKFDEVTEMTSQWLLGQLVPQVLASDRYIKPQTKINKIAFIKTLPVTLLTMLLGLMGAGLVALDQQTLYFAEPFLFQPMTHGELLPASEGMNRGEYWRLLTPMFLHFGVVHIIFNNLLIWLIGHRIEIAKGSLHLLLVLFLTGLVANLTQFFLTPNTIFGGLSGAAYGLVGYIMVYQRLYDHPFLHFPTTMLIVLILSLFLGVFGIFDLFMGNSGIANGAHIGGLVMGMILGFFMGIVDRQRHR